MSLFESSIVIIYGLLSLIIFFIGIYQSTKKNNPYGLTIYLFWMGIFVWGDAIVIGFFWFISSLISLLAKNWYLFLLIISVFWVIRGLGETIYWLNQQFSKTENNHYKKLIGFNFIKSDAIMFIYQTFWQCITVLSIIATVYLIRI